MDASDQILLSFDYSDVCEIIERDLTDDEWTAIQNTSEWSYGLADILIAEWEWRMDSLLNRLGIK